MSDLDREDRPLRPATEAPPVDLGEALRPAVAADRPATGLWWAAGGAAALGVVAFLVLSGHRGAQEREAQRSTIAGAGSSALPASGAVVGATAPPPEITAMESAARAPPPLPVVAAVPAPVVVPAPIVPNPAPVAVAAPPGTAGDLAARRKAPSLVVDLGQGTPSASTAAGASALRPAAVGAAADRPRLNGDEQFAERIGGTAEPERARATMLRNQGAVVAQGAVIPAVLETALNSDLPGYARAIVAGDVRSFDGSAVLIPRGSRLVGEYRSGVALGASRAFVIWTRLLRPDGGSVQIGSPATDPLGRAGLAGSVDRHFFQRFGGAVLLSVVNGGVAALTRGNSTYVNVGSSQDATGLGSLVSPTTISPTIKVPQGSPIRVFVARDLDFSGVPNGVDAR